jgi:tetratricopeptide (TPR) repeat protein
LVSGVARVVVLVAIGCALMVMGWSSPGHADAFDKHYKRGLALYQQKEYPGAIEEMLAAYELRQLPRLLFNLGQAFRKMGKAREALVYYERYLKAEPDAPQSIKTEIQPYIDQTRALIEVPTTSESIEKAKVNSPPVTTPASGQVKAQVTVKTQGPQKPRPLYKRAWFWGAIGGAVAATVIIGVTVGVVESRQLPSGITIIQF